MPRDPKAYLWDVREAADAIVEFIKDFDEHRYNNDAMIQSAVERQLEIIGEALNQLSALDEEIARQIPERREAIGLRNILVHGYATVNNALVWRTACNDVPVLRDRCPIARQLS